MNATSDGQSFDIRLTSDQLRRDARQAMNQFNRLSQHAVQQGRQIDTQFNSMGRNLSSAINKGVDGAKSALADLSKNILGISALLASGSFIKDIYSSVGEFNKQMRIVSTISEDVTDNMDKYKEQVLQLCTEIAVAPDIAAQALYQINSAGHLGQNGMKVLEVSAKAAVGGVTDVATAADAITTILNAYKFSADDAAAVSDKLFTTVRLGKTTMDELGRSIAYVAPLAANYKISIDEVLAAVAQLTKQGNSTQNAMTQISASINAVAAELGDDAFKDGLLPALEEIEKRSNGSNAALKAQLSNIRAVRGALGLTKENAEETRQMVEDIKNSAGAADEACKKMNTIGSAEITKLKNNFIKEFEGLASTGISVLGGLAKALNSAFNNGHMQEFLNILGLIIAAYGVNKGILLAMSAIENSTKLSLLNAEYEAWMRIIPVKQANANEDIEAAVAAGVLTEAKGAELIALREELAQKIANATAAKKLAADEVTAAQASLTAAEAKEAAAAQAIAAKEAELTASGQIYGAYVSENAVKELGVATDNAKTASLERERAAKRLATAQTKLSTASQELENLTNQQATITQSAQTASTGVLAAAKRVLTAVTAKLNAVMMANPYTLIAAAVIALGVAIHKLCTYESDLVRRQKAVDNAVASTSREYGEETNALDDLNSRLKAAKKGSEEWVAAKDEAVRKFGKYDNTLAAEIDRVGNLTTRYGQLTNSIRMSMAARAMERFQQENDPYEDIDDYLKTLNEKLGGTMYRADGSSWTISGPLLQQFQREMAQYVASGGKTKLSPKISEYLVNTTMGNNKFESGSFRQAWDGGNMMRTLNMAAVKQTSYTSSLDQIAAQYGYTPEEARQIREGRVNNLAATPGLSTDKNGATIQNKAYWEKQRDDAQAALDAMADTEMSSKKAIELKNKIIEANKILATKFSVKDEGNKGKSQAELAAEAAAAQQEEADLLQEQARVRARAEEDAQFQVEQAAINAMEDGAEKRLRQRRLDYEKEKAELQREMEDAILTEIEYQKAVFDAREATAEKEAAQKGNKNYAKRTFNPGNLMATNDLEGNTLYDANRLLTEATIGNVDTGNINEILNHYRQLFKDMETVHNQTWRNVQTDAMNEYLAQWGEGLEKRNAMIAVANRQMQQAETEGEALTIAAQLKKDLADFDTEANKKISAIGQLFGEMTDKTVKDLRKIYERGSDALAFITKGEWEGEKGAELGISKETFETLSKSPEELDRIKKALRDLKREVDGMENGFRKLARGLKDVFKSGNDPKKFKEALATISSGMQDVLQVAGFLQDSIGQLGEAFGSDVLGDIADGIGMAMDAMQGAMSGAQAGAMFGPWGAAAGAAIGLVSSLGSAISKLIDKKHEKKIEELQDQIDVLEESYDALGRQIEKAYSKDAKRLIEQQNELLKQQKILIQQQINEEKSKKKTDNDRIKEWEKQIRDINQQIADNKEKAIDAIYGEDIQTAISNFADAYESMFDGGTTRAKASKDIVKQMIKQMITEAMKSDISAPMEKLREMMMGFWSDGYISQWEQDQLNRYAEGVMADLKEQYGWADGYFKESTSQSRSKGGFTTMSQDTADELNGRFTALQMSNEVIKVSTTNINDTLLLVAARNATVTATVDEIRGLILVMVDHLETIRRHTANLNEMNERLGKIEKYTSRI